jgi:hypothetical protein
MPKKQRQKAERFDPVAIQAAKLAWARRATIDIRRCAAYYGMDQRELDLLGLRLALGEVGLTHDAAGQMMDAVRDLLREARRRATGTDPRPEDPAVADMLREELAKADKP